MGVAVGWFGRVAVQQEVSAATGHKEPQFKGDHLRHAGKHDVITGYLP